MSITLPNYISGKYAVGTECFTVVDDTRTEMLGPGVGSRKIAVRMYYPTNKETIKGMQKADIFTERKLKALGKAYFFDSKKLPSDMLVADYYEGAVHVENQ